MEYIICAGQILKDMYTSLTFDGLGLFKKIRVGAAKDLLQRNTQRDWTYSLKNLPMRGALKYFRKNV